MTVYVKTSYNSMREAIEIMIGAYDENYRKLRNQSQASDPTASDPLAPT